MIEEIIKIRLKKMMKTKLIKKFCSFSMSRFLSACLLLLTAQMQSVHGLDVQTPDFYSETYYTNIPTPNLSKDMYLDLYTPRKSVQNLYYNVQKDNLEKAAKSLNTALISRDDSVPMEHQRLAKKLHFLLENQVIFDWDEIPDLPEGRHVGKNYASQQTDAAIRTIDIGHLSKNGRSVPIRLQRVLIEQSGQLVWLFAPETVEYIPALYEKHSPKDWEKYIPKWFKFRYLRVPVWQWLLMPIVIGLFVAASLALHKGGVLLAKRYHGEILARLLVQLKLPFVLLVTCLFLKVCMLYIGSLSGPVLKFVNVVFSIAIIVAITMAVLRTIEYYSDRLTSQLSHNMDAERDRVKKENLTHLSVLRRVSIFLIVLIATGIILMQFELFGVFGTGILTSAGVLSVVLGIAAQASLANIMAGIQIAISKPVRIGDTLSYNGEWCYAEEITYTYISLRIWDNRRIIVPLSKFVSEPFENWSMKDSHIIKTIMLYVDYKADISAIRRHFEKLVKEHDLYDGGYPPTVQTYATTEKALVVRLLCSADNASDAWSLHCDLREKMLTYITELEEGIYLPRERQENLTAKEC